MVGDSDSKNSIIFVAKSDGGCFYAEHDAGFAWLRLGYLLNRRQFLKLFVDGSSHQS